MAKWICPCGNQMRSSGEIPNPQQWYLIADQDVDRVASAAEFKSDPDIAIFNGSTRLVFRCGRCDRLHIHWDAEKTWPPTVYIPEPDAYGTD